MAKVSGYKKNININEIMAKGLSPIDNRENLMHRITDKDTYLPNGVLHYDLDKGFKEFVTNTLSVTIDGKVVPVFMLNIQKWGEFTQTWEFVNEDKTIDMPFITIVRHPDTKPGTNSNLLYNIPGNKTYVYSEVPTWDGVRKGVTLYKIPHPTPIDIFYDVRIFSKTQTDLNSFNRITSKVFRSLEAYTNVNGHYIPILLENTSDESQIGDTEQRKFYVQLYEFTLQGFLLDPEDFIVIDAINRIKIST